VSVDLPLANAVHPFGATPVESGVHFSVWSPRAQSVDVALNENPDQRWTLEKKDQGLFQQTLADARAGTLYQFWVDGKGPFPDPASRFQPRGVHGPSQVIDPALFGWSDQAWRGLSLPELSIYELHVGTFTSEGTFTGVMDRVDLFAPAHAYGHPDDLRRLVDRAHRGGLSVLLDVVYNHLGPEGNYLGQFSPYHFTERHYTPWGAAVNLDGPHADMARSFFIENAVHWIREYHMDGLRLDATHALADDSPRHFLAELSDRVRTAAPDRKILLFAEDHRNLAWMVQSEKEKGWGMDGVWSDDFHHEVRRGLAGDHEGYYRDYSGSVADLAETVKKGWFFTGQPSVHFDGPRGTDPAGIPLERFVIALQNHDQIGNRPFGERLNHQISLPEFRAASALLLSVPETPLLFMGQEWGASSPFLYFTDHSAELGKLVTDGRREEFNSFSAFSDPAQRECIPDTQLRSTYMRSRLNWEERHQSPHSELLRLYQRLLHWRKQELVRSIDAGDIQFSAQSIGREAVWLNYSSVGKPRHWIFIQWQGPGVHAMAYAENFSFQTVLTTEDRDVTGDPRPIEIQVAGSKLFFEFRRPGALILKWKAL
jgi:maltooligosyltrehalose trehalohydrolase